MDLKPSALFVACSLALSAPAFANEPSVTSRTDQHTAKAAAPAPQRGAIARAPQRASDADMKRYSAREGASPGARNYEGGDATIVIGASAATIILAVILLVVLL